jgi:hypothetical protein
VVLGWSNDIDREGGLLPEHLQPLDPLNQRLVRLAKREASEVGCQVLRYVRAIPRVGEKKVVHRIQIAESGPDLNKHHPSCDSKKESN